MNAGDPLLDQLSLPGRLQRGHPPHHPDQHRGSGQRDDEEQPEELRDLPVLARRDQSCNRHHHQCPGRVDHHPGDGHRTGLGQPRADRISFSFELDSRCRLLLRQGDHRSAGYRDADGRCHRDRLGDRVGDGVHLLEDHVEPRRAAVAVAALGGSKLFVGILVAGRHTRSGVRLAHTVTPSGGRTTGWSPEWRRGGSSTSAVVRPTSQVHRASTATAASTTSATSDSARNR